MVVLCCLSLATQGQERVELSLNADIVSRYVWRGLDNGHASIQPSLEVAWKGISVSAWGSVGFIDKNDAKEIDLEASYTIGGLTLGIIDYWPDTPSSRYFNYNAHSTNHAFEGYISYDFGVLNLSWQTFFAGSDYVESKGRRAYSSYAELSVPFRLITCDWEAAIGVVTHESDYYETTGTALTNLSLKATKTIPITQKFVLPIFAQLMANPYAKHTYFVIGLSIGVGG